MQPRLSRPGKLAPRGPGPPEGLQRPGSSGWTRSSRVDLPRPCGDPCWLQGALHPTVGGWLSSPWRVFHVINYHQLGTCIVSRALWVTNPGTAQLRSLLSCVPCSGSQAEVEASVSAFSSRGSTRGDWLPDSFRDTSSWL